MRTFEQVTLCALSVALVACSSDRLEKGVVAQEWSRSTEQLSIRPIFPPRASVEVGDLYVVRVVNAGAKLKTADYYMSSVWFDRMSLDEELKKAAPHIQPAKTVVDATDKAKVMSVPDLVVPGTTTRINSLVAFPGFSFASLAESQLGLGITNSSIAALFGGARKSAYSVSYAVPVAETYGVKYSDARLAADIYINRYSKAQRERLRDAMQALENAGDPRNKDATKPVLVLVTQVYLTRSLEVVISSTESGGGQVSGVTRALTDLNERKTALEKQLRQLKAPDTPPDAAGGQAAGEGEAAKGKGADAPAKGTEAGDNKKGTETPDTPAKEAAVDNKQAELDQVNEQIRQQIEAVTPAMPGVTGSIVKSSATGVTLKQVFEYPVAIGYSGIDIDLDKFFKEQKVVIPEGVNTYPLKLTLPTE
ncbi:hypothetical protein KVG96_13240 [Pseudomonas sp. COR58]|uniref:Uncharacterized protein n=1 Tax=Pseudomonas ekonensis TaxID=2842353 RepID=A0ABS6PEN8_9PSED|nr:hypothetical protein [Pseudomonas ekonensis]MBV4458920.1 hypothetical protein [Pseudomonas ekonensis]